MKKLDGISKKGIYSVPDGYFERLPLSIEQLIDSQKIEVANKFVSTPVEHIFKTPPLYFEQLTEKIQNSIDGEPIRNSVVFQSIPKKSIFQIPDGYFDMLATTVQQRVQRKPFTSLDVLFPNLKTTLNYALAVVALAIGLVVYLRPDQIVSWENQLDEVKSEHLVSFLSESEVNENEIIEHGKFDIKDVDSLNLHFHSKLIFSEHIKENTSSELENEL